jgi:pyruvate dehydrogenase E2 component (dihydrolipoamide acetyltransferase)
VFSRLNLGVAVDLDFEGLIVPVVRGVAERSLADLARAIEDLAARARARRLTPDEVAHGTFTITNAGGFGTLFTAAIINQPQVAILSTDGVTAKPVAVARDDGSYAVEVRPVGVLTLTWDHRAFDGAYAAAFLKRLRTEIETRDWRADVRAEQEA